MNEFIGALGNSAKHGRWPDPFRNMVKRIDVLACEDTFLAQVTMYGLAFGSWFWSNIVPGPWEITRKTITGGYKCGFYSKVKVKSPIDIIWKNSGTAQFLMEISRPVTTGLFIMWGVNTVFEALQTWSTVMYAQEMCNLTRDETLLRDAAAPINTSHVEGAPAFATALWNPQSRANENGCSVHDVGPHYFTATAYGRFVSSGHTLTNIQVGMNTADGIKGIQSVGDCLPGQTAPFSVTWSDLQSPLQCQPWFSCDVIRSGVQASWIHLDRLIVKAVPDDQTPHWPHPLIAPGGPATDNPFGPFCSNFPGV